MFKIQPSHEIIEAQLPTISNLEKISLLALVRIPATNKFLGLCASFFFFIIFFQVCLQIAKKVSSEKGNKMDEDEEDDKIPTIFQFLLGSTGGAVIALFSFLCLCLPN